MTALPRFFLKFISLILGIESYDSFPPPLTREEEERAWKRLAEGDSSARDLIIERNLRLVSHIIKKYYS